MFHRGPSCGARSGPLRRTAGGVTRDALRVYLRRWLARLSAAAASWASSSTNWPAGSLPRLVCLACPQVDLFRVPVLAGPGAQWRGQVMQLGVGDGGGRCVVGLEGVDQTSSEAADKRPSQPGRSGLADRVPAWCGGARFGTAEGRRCRSQLLWRRRRGRPPRPGPVAMPPAATSGRSTRRATRPSRARIPQSSWSSASTNEPRCPPASTPWTTSASAPAAAAREASCGSVTVAHTDVPARWNRCTTERVRQLKVKETTATRCWASSSIFCRQWSSSNHGFPSPTPRTAAWLQRRSA